MAFKALPTCCLVQFEPAAGWIIVCMFRHSNRECLEASLGAVSLTQLNGEQSFPESHQLVDDTQNNGRNKVGVVNEYLCVHSCDNDRSGCGIGTAYLFPS